MAQVAVGCIALFAEHDEMSDLIRSNLDAVPVSKHSGPMYACTGVLSGAGFLGAGRPTLTSGGTSDFPLALHDFLCIS